jgi:hypothetical protein
MRSAPERALAWLAALCIVVALGACGADDEPAPTERPRETVDKLPELPPGWKPYVNRQVGFAIGRPPGWRATHRGASTLLRSPDHLVAVSISADRTLEAVEFPLDDYVERAAEALPRFKHLKVGRPRPFRDEYPAQAVGAAGVKDGVRQRMLFIALRRRGVVTYPLLVARNAERKSGYYYDEALRIVRTLRGRPLGPNG